jgi:hypothetical protein
MCALYTQKLAIVWLIAAAILCDEIPLVIDINSLKLESNEGGRGAVSDASREMGVCDIAMFQSTLFTHCEPNASCNQSFRLALLRDIVVTLKFYLSLIKDHVTKWK